MAEQSRQGRVLCPDCFGRRMVNNPRAALIPETGDIGTVYNPEQCTACGGDGFLPWLGRPGADDGGTPEEDA
ncbi:MAG: hypothetical protein ACJ73S_31990 [Mycobacteriales bacterium]